MAFNRPTLTELRARIQADINGRLPGADSALRRSVVNVLATVLAGAAHGLYGVLAFLARQLMPDEAESAYLRRWASIWGVVAKEGAPAAGTMQVTGANGSPIEAGTPLQRGDELQYATTADAVIAGGVATLSIEAQTPGVIGNADAGARLTFVSPVAGVAAEGVVLAPGLSGGTEEESDEALLARLLERIRRPPQGGSADDYVRWATEVPGVTRAWAYSGWTGPGRVGVTFVMDARDNIIPLADDVAAVTAHIDPLRPVAGMLVVFAPTGVPLNLTISLPGGSADVKAAIIAEVQDFLRRRAEPDGVIEISGLREAVFTGAGDAAHTLTVPTANIAYGPGELAVMGVVTWTT
ncbi:baseplate J/gp47 family protein [Caulobacter soli]|uniref:baseplate J/gp47 family protein n=1 Tax=Caulobacter soli TaxID=2708539 RepID=UPI0013EA4D40|nr:baseplate J/gp47 family protein [Caulobacter soli]